MNLQGRNVTPLNIYYLKVINESWRDNFLHLWPTADTFIEQFYYMYFRINQAMRTHTIYFVFGRWYINSELCLRNVIESTLCLNTKPFFNIPLSRVLCQFIRIIVILYIYTWTDLGELFMGSPDIWSFPRLTSKCLFSNSLW